MVTPKRPLATCLTALRREIAVGVALEALFVFAAFAGVRHAAEAVHGDGQRLVRLLADGAEAHGAGGEALDDLLGRLDFFDRNRLVGVLQLAAGRAACRDCGSGRRCRSVYSWKVAGLFCRTACCSLLMVCGLSR